MSPEMPTYCVWFPCNLTWIQWKHKPPDNACTVKWVWTGGRCFSAPVELCTLAGATCTCLQLWDIIYLVLDVCYVTVIYIEFPHLRATENLLELREILWLSTFMIIEHHVLVKAVRAFFGLQNRIHAWLREYHISIISIITSIDAFQNVGVICSLSKIWSREVSQTFGKTVFIGMVPAVMKTWLFTCVSEYLRLVSGPGICWGNGSMTKLKL